MYAARRCCRPVDPARIRGSQDPNGVSGRKQTFGCDTLYGMTEFRCAATASRCGTPSTIELRITPAEVDLGEFR